jgi:hypothetical protein
LPLPLPIPTQPATLTATSVATNATNNFFIGASPKFRLGNLSWKSLPALVLKSHTPQEVSNQRKLIGGWRFSGIFATVCVYFISAIVKDRFSVPVSRNDNTGRRDEYLYLDGVVND